MQVTDESASIASDVVSAAAAEPEPAPGAPAEPTLTQLELLGGAQPRSQGRPCAAFHREKYADLPGKPLTLQVDVANPDDFCFPRAVARFAGLYSHLALVASRGPHGADLAATDMDALSAVLSRSPRWLHAAFKSLASYGLVYSVPAPPRVAAAGFRRLLCLRVPSGSFETARLAGTRRVRRARWRCVAGAHRRRRVLVRRR